MKLIDLFEKVEQNELYHVMDSVKAHDAIKHNKLRAWWRSKIDGDIKTGTSFSRNSRFWFYDRKWVKLTVDRNKLKARNKIIPVDAEFVVRDTHGMSSRAHDRHMNANHQVMAEEFVIGDIAPLNRVVKSVELRFPQSTHVHEMHEVLDAVEEWCESYNIPLVLDPKIKQHIEKMKREWEEDES
jgi:hypothetical protein